MKQVVGVNHLSPSPPEIRPSSPHASPTHTQQRLPQDPLRHCVCHSLHWSMWQRPREVTPTFIEH